MPERNRRWIFYDSSSKTQSNPVTTEDAQMAILKMSERDTTRFFIWTAGWEKWQPLKSYLQSKQKHFFSSLAPNNVPEDTLAQDTVKALARDVLEMKPAAKGVEEEVTKSNYGYSVTPAHGYSTISLKEEDIAPREDHGRYDKFDADDINIDNVKKPKVSFKSLNAKNLKDRSDRHELKIEILLMTPKGKTFRSCSQNISMSGSLLEDNIPFEYCGGVIDIVVINTQPCDPKFKRVSLKGKTVGEGMTQRVHFVNMSPALKKGLQSLLESYVQLQEAAAKKTA
jgi:hypothetical protein